MGWKFPPTSGGKEDGWNDSGIAHFTGTPLSSLARETIQNSLDGRKSEKLPVEVIFELLEVDPSIIGHEELQRVIAACKKSADELEDVKASETLTEAQKILAGSSISCLRISDENTTGLVKKCWHALVKMQGLSQKSEGSGGSHGIGKYAPFAVSTLRTVFYWTCYKENGRDIEKCQGKAVLMSHEDRGRRQGTGFFGINKGCEPLVKSIPKRLRNMRGETPVYGTSLLAMGFSEESQWQKRIASSIIENYFYAIDKGTLKIILEPDVDVAEEIDINSKTLPRWFDSLLGDPPDQEQEEEDGSALGRAKSYYELGNEVSPVGKQDPDLGHCKLFVKLGEGLPSRVALVRGTGMLVTDQQKGLMRFPLHQDFAAMCVFEDTAGNELLRQMESPRHDEFEPDRLPKNERARGRRALKRIIKWIREEVKAKAGPRDSGQKTILSELATYLPDLYPDEPFDDATNDGDREKGFGDRITVKLKPIRLPPVPPPPEPDEEPVSPRPPSPTPSPERRLLPISAVRVIPIPGNDNHYHLNFTPHRTGIARIEIKEAGDSSTNPAEDVRVVEGSTHTRSLTAGERISVKIVADKPIRDRALHVEAVEEIDE